MQSWIDFRFWSGGQRGIFGRDNLNIFISSVIVKQMGSKYSSKYLKQSKVSVEIATGRFPLEVP